MTKFECTKDTPWGIHQSLEALECPRCGWTPDLPDSAAAPALPEAAGPLGWSVLIGGLAAAA